MTCRWCACTHDVQCLHTTPALTPSVSLTRQWQRDGLAVRGDRIDYNVSQLQLLGTRTTIAAEETAAVLRSATGHS